VLAFLAGAGFVAAARPWVKLERPQPVTPVRPRARANELHASKRRPMIGGEERAQPVGCGLSRAAVRWVGSRVGCVGRQRRKPGWDAVFVEDYIVYQNRQDIPAYHPRGRAGRHGGHHVASGWARW
jgi:hypothetical protein